MSFLSVVSVRVRGPASSTVNSESGHVGQCASLSRVSSGVPWPQLIRSARNEVGARPRDVPPASLSALAQRRPEAEGGRADSESAPRPKCRLRGALPVCLVPRLGHRITCSLPRLQRSTGASRPPATSPPPWRRRPCQPRAHRTRPTRAPANPAPRSRRPQPHIALQPPGETTAVQVPRAACRRPRRRRGGRGCRVLCGALRSAILVQPQRA
ncbi:hypothetical protein DMC30DRAFT_127620 [Rhodotorula diobovata]|uniref:Uncharacterized protein n=1 Tax=Rhodotorula diobovata TaxID=5288 RepID=A0A5C5FKS3_9BASI|nr:hypothetical protein DMC30DRAFT_127620 [Rhodotorula diobovata]